MTDGSSASGAAAPSQFELSFGEPSRVTTGISCCTVTTIAVSSVLKRQELSLSEHWATFQQLATHRTTTSSDFVNTIVNKLNATLAALPFLASSHQHVILRA
jgi:hypothetical protein